ncbi:MAG: cupin domain-containing protein [Phycisphaerales bacterium]
MTSSAPPAASIPGSRGLIRNLADAAARPVDMQGVAGVRMAVMCGREHGAPHFALRQFIVEPGGHSPRHSHDYEHEVYVVSGGGTVLLGGREHPVRAGDVVYVPADEEHQFKAAPGGGGGNAPGGMTFLCLVPVSRNCGEVTPGS